MRELSKPLAFWLMTAFLLLAAGARINGLATVHMDVDEVWSIWQSVDGPAQIISRTPYDWMPVYFLALGFWTSLAGEHPLAVHLFALLTFLLSTACAYQAGRLLGGRRTGLVLAVAYAAIGFNAYAATYIRGLALALTLLPAALWMTLRYLKRPTWRRAIVAALPMSLMTLIYLNAPFAVALMTGFLVVLRGRQARALWRPLLAAVLISGPFLVFRAEIILFRTTATNVRPALTQPLEDAGHFVYEVLNDSWPLWILLLCILAFTYALSRKGAASRRFLLAALFWLISGPVIFYIMQSRWNFFSAHYTWWAAFTVALLISALSLHLRPRAVIALCAFMGVVALTPINRWIYEVVPTPPLAYQFPWLSARYRSGDVVLFDPNQERWPEVWDYFRRNYFPNGLEVVDDPTGHRRIWYISTTSREDAATRRSVEAGRLALEYAGPWNFLIRLYEGPPDPDGIGFENGMRLHGVEILPNRGVTTESGVVARLEGEPLRLRLWWSADRALDRDYSTNIRIQQNGTAVTELNGPPVLVDGPAQTSQWIPGSLYFEDRTIDLPEQMRSGPYTIEVIVYYWEAPTPVPASGQADGIVPVGTFTIKSWN